MQFGNKFKKQNKPCKIIYIAAIGATVKSFLQDHLITLQEEGYEVILICSPGEKTTTVISNTGVKYTPANIRTDIAFLPDVVALIKITRILLKERPQVVHAHMSKAGLISMIAARLCAVPHRIYHNHGMAAFSSIGIKRLVLGTVERITCGLATVVLFCGQSTLEEAVKANFCSRTKATVLGNGTISGIDLNRFRRITDPNCKSHLLTKYGVREHTFTVGYVGRVVAHKGIDNIITAWPQVRDKTDIPVQLLLAGDNDNNDLYARLVNLCRSQDNVIYLGRIDSINEIYQLLDILILPSWHEGFPYSVLEAQCTGVPAIVTNVPGNTDAVLPGETGLHIPVGQPELLAEAIAELANQEITRTNMSLQAQQRVQQFFSKPTVLENLRSFYKDLLLT